MVDTDSTSEANPDAAGTATASAATTGTGTGPRPKPIPSDDGPVLPQVSSDERHGWGEDPNDGVRDDDWYRRERPPHHG